MSSLFLKDQTTGNMDKDLEPAIELEQVTLSQASITPRKFSRRRWLGLAQLTLLNAVVSFDVST